MKVEAFVLLGVAIFFGIVGAVYWFTSYEDGGTMMLVGTCLLGLLPGSYYYWWHRRMGDRPEDRDDATIEDGAGQIDTFPSSSIWPFVLGMGAFGIALAAVFGVWLLVPAFSLVFSAAIGYTAESRRGGQI